MEVFDPGDQNCNSLEFVPDSLEYMDPTGCATEQVRGDKVAHMEDDVILNDGSI